MKTTPRTGLDDGTRGPASRVRAFGKLRQKKEGRRCQVRSLRCKKNDLLLGDGVGSVAVPGEGVEVDVLWPDAGIALFWRELDVLFEVERDELARGAVPRRAVRAVDDGELAGSGVLVGEFFDVLHGDDAVVAGLQEEGRGRAEVDAGDGREVLEGRDADDLLDGGVDRVQNQLESRLRYRKRGQVLRHVRAREHGVRRDQVARQNREVGVRRI
mmetsp:Transcript_9213/g.28270  ORF Transcript_9213/g.28270 Transcript_9213/m.28270 type:complete len:214 (-) Transcript_9213:662-1303(-)